MSGGSAASDSAQRKISLRLYASRCDGGSAFEGYLLLRAYNAVTVASGTRREDRRMDRHAHKEKTTREGHSEQCAREARRAEALRTGDRAAPRVGGVAHARVDRRMCARTASDGFAGRSACASPSASHLSKPSAIRRRGDPAAVSALRHRTGMQHRMRHARPRKTTASRAHVGPTGLRRIAADARGRSRTGLFACLFVCLFV